MSIGKIAGVDLANIGYVSGVDNKNPKAIASTVLNDDASLLS